MSPLVKKFPNGFEIELIEYYPRLVDWYLNAEKETEKWLCDNVKKDWNCVEVGAHIGYTSILLSKLARHVYAFEANNKAARMFHHNVLHNEKSLNINFDNIEFFPFAVGNNSGVMAETLYLAGEDDKFGETHGEFTFVTLDEVLVDGKYNIERLDLIFTDADGWDYDVLMGAQKCIERFHPFIIMEANYALAWRGHTINDVKKLAERYKYQYKWLDEQCPGNLLLC